MKKKIVLRNLIYFQSNFILFTINIRCALLKKLHTIPKYTAIKCVKGFVFWKQKKKLIRRKTKLYEQLFLYFCGFVITQIKENTTKKKRRTCRPLRYCQMFHNFAVLATTTTKMPFTYYGEHRIVWNRLQGENCHFNGAKHID